jgi:hypothetical protein
VSHASDSRDPKGLGYLILQDHRPVDPDVRGAVVAIRSIDRDRKYGVHIADEDSHGDLLGASCWPAGSRPMPAWGFAWSVLAVGGEADAPYTGPGSEGGSPNPVQPRGRGAGASPGTEAVGGTPPSEMLPAWKIGRAADPRFAAQPLLLPEAWPAFPRGWSGIAVAGTDESEQVLHFHPTDPRLVSPHRGVPELSSIVTDCKGVEPDLAARLAHHLFVVHAPSVGGAGGTDTGTVRPATAAGPAGAGVQPGPGGTTTQFGGPGGIRLRSGAGDPPKSSGTANRLAWLIGESSSFKGGFVVDNEPPQRSGGGGTFTGPNSRVDPYSRPSPNPVRPASESGPGAASANGPGGGSGAPNLPAGSGNLARALVGAPLDPTTSDEAAHVLVPHVERRPELRRVRIVQPRAHPLSSLGIKVGTHGGRKIVALVSSNDGGFLHVGTHDDAHRIGEDADGNPINPAHISIDALFYADKERDGPLGWHHEYPVFFEDDVFDVFQPVYMAFDGESGRWGWWTKTGFDRVVVRFPRGGTATIGDPRRPTTPGGGSGALIGDPAGPREYQAAHAETAFAVVLGRPQSQSGGAADLRVSLASPEDLGEARRAPVVARIEAYGRQRGDLWQRTHPEDVLYRGGTAPGGFALLPPEARLEDAAPDGYALSTTYFTFAPGTRLGFGAPNLANGGLSSGWSLRLDGADLALATFAADRLRIIDDAASVVLKVTTASQSIRLRDSADNTVLEIQGADKVAFHGATPQAKATITGVRSDPEGALKNLLAALAARGDFTDSTTA